MKSMLKLPYSFHSERWKNRRKMIFQLFYVYIAFVIVVMVTLLFSVLFKRTMDENLVDLVSSVFMTFSTLMGTVIIGYLFGAVLDDNNFKDKMGDVEEDDKPLKVEATVTTKKGTQDGTTIPMEGMGPTDQ